jgi:HK97 family phage prohead protease
MLERRFMHSVELRAEGQGDELSLIGYAARFRTLSEDLGGFRETICRGCFTRSLQSDRDIKALLNHDPSAAILGRKKNGTLFVSEDDKGLKFRAILPQTAAARDVWNLVQARYADSCSFAFEIDPGNEGDDPGEDWGTCIDESSGQRMRLRTLKRVKLHDVSVLTAQPAYPTGTSVEANRFPEFNSRSVIDLFPEGIPQSFPVEVRSRILTSGFSKTDSRRRVIDFILS